MVMGSDEADRVDRISCGPLVPMAELSTQKIWLIDN